MNKIDKCLEEFDISCKGYTMPQATKKMYRQVLERLEALEEKLEILVHEPTPEQLQKHKTLKSAYKQYKFVENLVLGDEK